MTTNTIPQKANERLLAIVGDELAALGEVANDAVDAAVQAAADAAESEKTLNAARAADAVSQADALQAGRKPPPPTLGKAREAHDAAVRTADATAEVARRQLEAFRSAAISGEVGAARRAELQAGYDDAVNDAYASVARAATAVREIANATRALDQFAAVYMAGTADGLGTVGSRGDDPRAVGQFEVSIGHRVPAHQLLEWAAACLPSTVEPVGAPT